MSRGYGQLVLAALLLTASALLARVEPGAAVVESPGSDEPLALALAPLGPVTALVSSALWVELLQGQIDGDSERIAALARALLALHPTLSTVREYLAGQLLVTEAPRAPDRERHGALVAEGLALFEDGLALHATPALHSAFGRTLVVQAEIDPRFAAAAERCLGETAEDRALRELHAAGPAGIDAWLAADLHIRRGLSLLRRDDDRAGAARDLAAARALLVPLATGDDERQQAAGLLQPLSDALDGTAVPEAQPFAPLLQPDDAAEDPP